MNIRIIRTIIIFFAAVSAGISLSSCSGEKEVSSYPVTNLTPQQHGYRTQLPCRKKRSFSQEVLSDNSASGFQRLPVSSAESKTAVTFTFSNESKYEMIRQERDQAYFSSVGNDELIADLETKPEACVKKVIKHTTGLPKIIIPADDTIQAENKGMADETPGKKDPKDMNGFGIVSLVTGIAGITAFPFLAPVAIVFGAIGLNKRQKGMAIAGFVLGIVTVVLYSLLIILLLSSL